MKLTENTFDATTIKIRSINNRYCLYVKISDTSRLVKLDIHDTLSENISKSDLTQEFIQKLFTNLPRHIIISNKHGFFEIVNEAQIFSKAIAKTL